MGSSVIDFKQPDSKYDYLFEDNSSKYNENVKLTKFDKNNNTRILCKEPYAQSLYDLYSKSSTDIVVKKDLDVGSIYTAKVTSYNASDRLVTCEEVNSKSSIYVSISEFKDNDFLQNKKPFELMIVNDFNGTVYGSIKKCANIVNLKLLNTYLENNTVFEITISRLIRGGFIAVFDNSIECFLPGAHAAANVIHDFESYIGKTIKVMVDNYDPASRLFVLSHKKYIRHILPDKIKTLEFGKKYSGYLTSKPTKFGIFVEFDEIFTGLIHITEFENYESFIKNIKQGDQIDFYITRILIDANGKYKINLTLDYDRIDEINIIWNEYKNTITDKTFDYSYDIDTESIKIIDSSNGNTILSLIVPHEAIKDSVFKKTKIKILDIDVIHKKIGFDFV